ncbi:uncharacterized protein LTR77_001148 [Saxophila tyrrhenica]|uniref:Acyltransferase MbtK/IucB-like conserved domain-containing protein n=1 Tax=Saxophila tyrrhenica TaxID=1690608 RepID=A0AAV9PM16_9PEZI|nr:hypothetical protein LTR77_001148 [Saxophila tyrrhenica]
MAPSIVHLPNGMTLTVQPVFGGLSFKTNDLTSPHSAFPPGWTIILNSEDDAADHIPPTASMAAHTHAVHAENDPTTLPKKQDNKNHHVHRFRKPSLHNDHLFISSISNPSSSEFKPSSSPTRSIAMMLWATLWWYFHQPEPEPWLTTAASVDTPLEGRPKGEWRVNINREGIFKGKHLLPKLERMGLIASEDSSVGLDPEDGVGNAGEGWTKMFVSRKSFWQLDPRIYLFTLSPNHASSPFPSVSPASSRPASPNRGGASTPTHLPLGTRTPDHEPSTLSTLGSAPPHPLTRHNTPPGPYSSSSHLPTFYPPPPLQYTRTNGLRHPIRPKPPRQGETFYTRFIPSLNQYLSLRVASRSRQPCVHRGPTATGPTQNTEFRVPRSGAAGAATGSDALVPTLGNMGLADRLSTPPPPGSSGGAGAAGEDTPTTSMTDEQLLHRWMNLPRVSHSWGEHGPLSHQAAFLAANLTSTSSFPAIGLFDGKPFAYFELYWVRESALGAALGPGEVGEWDRGIHCLVGEQEFRGWERVRVWLSALVHWCLLSDMRCAGVWMEPRVDNLK